MKKNLLIAVVSLALLAVAGCVTIPPEHQADYNSIKLKEQVDAHEAKLDGTTASLEFRYKRVDYEKPWIHGSFEIIDPDVFNTMFKKIRTIAHEELPNYSGAGYALKGAIFGHGAYSFEPIIRIYKKEKKDSKKIVENDRAVEFLAEEFRKHKEQFDSGTYNYIYFYFQGCSFNFYPKQDDGQPRILLSVVDTAGMVARQLMTGSRSDESAHCSFLFNYRGHALATKPEREKEIQN